MTSVETVPGSAASSRRRFGPRLAHAGDGLLITLPAAFLVVFSFHAGGYFPAITALGVLVLLGALALRAVLGGRPFAGISPLYVVVATCLGLFAIWTLVSSAWSDAPARALIEYDRALLYFLGFVVIGALGRTTLRLRWMMRSIAAGIFGVCTCALITRLLPALWPVDPEVAVPRLNYPLTYWNSLGLLAALGVVLCFALTCDGRESRAGRVLSAAALPVLALTLLLTFSRGGMAVAIVGLVVFVVVGRPRALITGLLAVAPAVGVALVAGYRADLLSSHFPTSAAAAAQGKHLALVLVGCVAVAVLGRAALLKLDAWPRSGALPEILRRPQVRWGAAALALIAGVAVAGAVSAVRDHRAVRTFCQP